MDASQLLRALVGAGMLSCDTHELRERVRRPKATIGARGCADGISST